MDEALRRRAGIRAVVAVAVGGLLLTGCGALSLGVTEDVSVSAAAARKGGLKFSISLAKKSFAPGDPIPLRMRLRNVGENAVKVNKRFLVNDRAVPPEQREVFLNIRMPSGATAEFAWDIRVGDPDKKDFRRLKPGKAASGRADINDLYFLTEEGTYKVKATYKNSHPGASRVKRTSNALKFSVKS